MYNSCMAKSDKKIAKQLKKMRKDIRRLKKATTHYSRLRRALKAIGPLVSEDQLASLSAKAACN